MKGDNVIVSDMHSVVLKRLKNNRESIQTVLIKTVLIKSVLIKTVLI